MSKRLIFNRSIRLTYAKSILLALLASSAWATGEKVDWSQQSSRVQDTLLKALEAHAKGAKQDAKRLCDDAYFGVFEQITANMEVAIRKFRSAKRAAEIENSFGEIRKSINLSKPEAEIKKRIESLSSDVAAEARELDKMKVTNP